tara:strand:- start:108 stop:293 length:186 start_codon:yes stop_codon:yes gene_type:complete
MPIVLALTALGVSGIFGLEKLTGKTDKAIETTGDFIGETILPAFFFGASLFILLKATQGKK